jgi:CO/xanthine dehydrogenase FAD-binding subunit
MRSVVPAYQMRTARDLPEALSLVAERWKPFAGGTDLMVLLEAGKLAQRQYLNLWSLAELRGIAVESENVSLGALTTYSEIQRHAVLRAEFPMLCEAAAQTGGIATQNRGTLGGNIANASPAADSPPALLAYDAELEFASLRGTRRIPYSRFHRNYKQMDLADDELIHSIRLPRTKKSWSHFYRKVGTRKAQAISKVCFAGAGLLEHGAISDIRLALGSVAPTVVRCFRTEELLRGNSLNAALIQAARASLALEIAPIDDMRSTRDYRLRVAQNVLQQFLLSLTSTDPTLQA